MELPFWRTAGTEEAVTARREPCGVPPSGKGRIAMNHGAVSPEIAKGLKVLRSRIAKAKIPSSKLDETLNLATWNIREFCKKARSDAAIHYIAEVLGQFDLVSIAELRGDLHDLNKVLGILGP